MAVVWSAPTVAACDLREFGDEAVLFDARTGRTHYISAAGAAILDVLSESAYETAALVIRLEEEFSAQFDEADRSRILAALEQLAALELISCIDT